MDAKRVACAAARPAPGELRPPRPCPARRGVALSEVGWNFLERSSRPPLPSQADRLWRHSTARCTAASMALKGTSWGPLTALEATSATQAPTRVRALTGRVWALTALNPFRSRAYVRDAVFSNNGQINGCGWIGLRQGSSSFAQISPVFALMRGRELKYHDRRGSP